MHSFSRESKLNIVGFDCQEWCWKRPREPLSSCVVSKTVKHGGRNIMVWEDIGELTKIERTMNSEHYHDILQDNLSMLIMKFGRNKLN